MNLLCRIGLHKWGVWSRPRPTAIMGESLWCYQRRSCARCNASDNRGVVV
jgi:hypothetical protein